MVEQIPLSAIPQGLLEEHSLVRRRCTQQRWTQAMDERRLKDLHGYRMDECGRLKEAMSRTGFFTRYEYCDNNSAELRCYLILDPNHQLLERAVLQPDNSWTIERFNPAKGKIEAVQSPYRHIKVDENGNLIRVENSGNKDTVSIRMESRKQVVNALTPTRSWLAM